MRKNITTLSVLATAVATIVLFSGCNDLRANAARQPANLNPQPLSAQVADVNGVALTERHLLPLLQLGMDKANAVDKAINKAIAAELAASEYPSLLSDAMEAAKLDIAAQVYLQNKMASIGKSITDEEIGGYFEALIKKNDFNAYKVKAGVFATEQAALAAISASRKRESEDFALVSEKYISANEIPYGLGGHIKALKPGDFTAPMMVRNGFVVLRMVEVKENPAPELSSMKEQVRALITQERVNQELAKARGLAKISLK